MHDQSHMINTAEDMNTFNHAKNQVSSASGVPIHQFQAPHWNAVHTIFKQVKQGSQAMGPQKRFSQNYGGNAI